MAFFFLFKQKTAYEMRISDWSSDVCSSDLKRAARHRIVDHREPLDAPRDPIAADRFDGHPRLWRQPPLGTVVGVHEQYHAIVIHPAIAIAVAVDRGVELIVRAHRRQPQHRAIVDRRVHFRSEEPTSELQSLMRNSYAVF